MTERKEHADRHPQFLRGAVSEPAANTIGIGEINTNVPVSIAGKVRVLELCRILANGGFGDFEDGSEVRFAASSIRYATMPSYDQAGVFWRHSLKTVGAGGDTENQHVNHSLLGSDGKGPLVGSGKIWIYAHGVGQNDPTGISLAIEYKLTDFEPGELVGLTSFA